MALTISTCLANRKAGQPISVTDAGSQISFDSASHQIRTTQNDFLSKGFRPGLVIKVTNSSLNNGLFEITNVAGDGSALTVAQAISDEAASAATPTLTVSNGQSLLTLINYGIFVVYASPMVDVNAAITSQKLLEMTVDGLSFTPGTSTNGITWEFDSAGKIKLSTGNTIKGTGLANGTAYFGRIYCNGYITGDDSTNNQSIRIQGRIGTGNSQDFSISSTDIKLGVVNTLDSFNLTEIQVGC